MPPVGARDGARAMPQHTFTRRKRRAAEGAPGTARPRVAPAMGVAQPAGFAAVSQPAISSEDGMRPLATTSSSMTKAGVIITP